MDWTKNVRYKELQKRYIDEFFYGDRSLWESSKQPFMDLKHLFRKIINDHLIPVKIRQAELEGVHHSSIRRSVSIANPQLHPKLEQSAKQFLVKQLEQDPQTYVKRRMQKHLTQGYTHDDIARHYLVHDNVIHKIFDNQPVADQTIQYIYKQMQK